MDLMSSDALWRSENTYKEQVYDVFDDMRSRAHAGVVQCQAHVDREAFEEQISFLPHSELATAREKQRKVERLLTTLCPAPYYAHIELESEARSDPQQFFLSDCETLEQAIPIGDAGLLLPFKEDKARPISAALIRCYDPPDGHEIRYRTCEGREELLRPALICTDEIRDRELLNVLQRYPEPTPPVDADELLTQRLQEVRDDPVFGNIIATLQQKQFQIISTDAGESFVVQGCAGSGKSQCLLHRLFYLRDSLTEDGWDHVLLVTPTQLFRNYAAELVRRYRLSDVQNGSISELYRRLLTTFDPRFRDRQYLFELSEEYLPDRYLQEVYSEAMIERIDRETSAAIRKYVGAGCTALGLETPADISAAFVTGLLGRLDEEIEAFASREAVLMQDPVYAERRAKYAQLQQKQLLLQRELERLSQKETENNAKLQALVELLEGYQAACAEREAWKKSRAEALSTAQERLSELERALCAETFAIDLPARYAKQLYLVYDLLSGAAQQEDKAYACLLDDACAKAKQRCREASKNRSPERYCSLLQKRGEDLAAKRRACSDELEEIGQQLMEHTAWLRERAEAQDGERSKITLQRSELDRARYFLSRLESTVFEQEVWKALLPAKERYGVKSLQIETLADGHMRETKILYKSDLLFYVKIYAKLHPNTVLPPYRLFCIDEGQDLHKAEYDLLHDLYPQAVFNVFGDTAQVLHTACGIHDWRAETGVSQIYHLERNYRNTAAIVAFCNENFGTAMEAVGRVLQAQYPIRLRDAEELRGAAAAEGVVTIVKDQEAFAHFCEEAGVPADGMLFLDTRAELAPDTKRICYSIFAAKGLEFSSVLVYARQMTTNQKVVACTRAMGKLYYYE